MSPEEIFNKPYWIIDILPKQVPADSPGQYFSVEPYFRQEGRKKELYRKYLEIFLKLNCYYDIRVSCDYGEHWETNPEPGEMEEWFLEDGTVEDVWVAFFAEGALAVLDKDDTYLTVYDPPEELLLLLRLLSRAAGLFMWKPEDDPQ